MAVRLVTECENEKFEELLIEASCSGEESRKREGRIFLWHRTSGRFRNSRAD